MRSVALLGVVLVALAVAAVASPAVTSWLAEVGWRVPLARVYDRVFEILLALGLWGGWRWFDLGSAAAIGLRTPEWSRGLRRGLVIGLAGVSVGLALAWAAGGIVPARRYPPGKTVWKALQGALGAVLVGVGEEVLFRGVLLRRCSLDFGARAGVVITTVIYAVVHALRTRGGGDLVGPWAGVERTLGLFAPLADPTAWPSVVGLGLLGLLLVTARQQSGNLWMSIGIHAAWVAVFRVGRLFMHVRAQPVWVVGPGWPPLIGGLAGILGLAVSAALLRRHALRPVRPVSR
jgi:uncharacterized protein